KEFCVITPYDAQRAAIERQLKAENLPHNAVYNVDSFQGNEADYVLVSVVRTEAPGFLRSLNRMNVMLTRAKKGMVIVTCSSFLRSHGGAQTLLGRLARYWETRKQETWIDWRRIVDGTADLPGSSGTPSLTALSLQSPLAQSRKFPLVAAAPAFEKLAVSPSIIAARTAETGEKWRRPGIKHSDSPPLTSTYTFFQRAKVGLETSFSM
ncbi:AAA domain-containing protein, partial [Mycena capillaripes]